jgi:hypothetical protein
MAAAQNLTDPADGALNQLRQRSIGFLDAFLTPHVERILLIDGPAVLGWVGWREVESGRSGQRQNSTTGHTPSPAVDQFSRSGQTVDLVCAYLVSAPLQHNAPVSQTRKLLLCDKPLLSLDIKFQAEVVNTDRREPDRTAAERGAGRPLFRFRCTLGRFRRSRSGGRRRCSGGARRVGL